MAFQISLLSISLSNSFMSLCTLVILNLTQPLVLLNTPWLFPFSCSLSFPVHLFVLLAMPAVSCQDTFYGSIFSVYPFYAIHVAWCLAVFPFPGNFCHSYRKHFHKASTWLTGIYDDFWALWLKQVWAYPSLAKSEKRASTFYFRFFLSYLFDLFSFLQSIPGVFFK